MIYRFLNIKNYKINMELIQNNIQIPESRPKTYFCEECQQTYQYVYKDVHQVSSKHKKNKLYGAVSASLRTIKSRTRAKQFYYDKLSADSVKKIAAKKIFGIEQELSDYSEYHDDDDPHAQYLQRKIHGLYSYYFRIAAWRNKISNMQTEIQLLNNENENENEGYEIDDNDNLEIENEVNSAVLLNNIEILNNKIDRIVKLHFI